MNNRLVVILAGALAGLIVVVIFHFTLDDGSLAAKILIDKEFDFIVRYPVTVNNAMWIIFGISLAELLARNRVASLEYGELRKSYLPEDRKSLLQANQLGEYYRKVEEGAFNTERFLPRLIARIILQFQSSRSIDQANSLLNSSMELFNHEVDLRYNNLRYYMWVIPTFGFIGTVIGIAGALTNASTQLGGGEENLLAVMTKDLGTAFFTTLLALLIAAVIVLFTNIVQGREERALNLSGQYCLDNLINRLYEKD